MQKVASVVGQFLDYHVLRDQAVTQKESLLTEISNTERYLEPIMEAMLLEGSYHVADPCYACDDGETCHIGSPWIEQMQLGIAQNDSALAGKVGSVRDEFRQSWWLNPFADPPFYHPRATRGDDQKLKIETITEAVYERLDFAIDCSLVSNTALELRTKLNSPQAMLKALRVDAAFAPSDGACSSMNRKTIEWAIDHAPDIVKKRYLERGRKLVAGTDIPHSSGPSWIWSYLQYTKTGKSDEDAGDSEECVIVDSHAMNTPIEHPVPFAGGKLYCKILSPARVLDWMYTDSLRQPVR